MTSNRRPGRLDSLGTSIFTEMSILADLHGAVNLGQGFPDEDGPAEVLEAAARAIRDGHNQYPPGRGVATLIDAIAAHESRFFGLELDPGREILVTAGATEAIAATVLALCDEGDEVVVFEPYYDSYAATIELARARRRVVPMRPPLWSVDPTELEAAITPRTRLMLVNSPHNPTGHVLTPAELGVIADACVRHDIVAVTDEVYEHLLFEGEHVPLATLPGMRERTIKISSGGKTFSTTGWKIGWALGPAHLIESVRAVKQFITFASGTAFQYGIAAGLRLPDEYFDRSRDALFSKCQRLCDGLSQLGWEVLRPQATYFATADVSSFGEKDADAFCRRLVADAGVAAVPVSAFCDSDQGDRLVRFAFCKRPEVIDEALRRLARLPAPG